MKPILTASVCVALCSAPALAQNYNGVAPGSNVVPEHIAAQPGGAPTVTWPGFQLTPDGGSRLFVQTSNEVKAELKQDGHNWLVILPGVQLPAGNARLPLDTEFFNTPLKAARLKAREGGGVAIHLEMKPGVGVQPRLRSEKAPNGYFFTYIDFPPGNYKR